MGLVAKVFLYKQFPTSTLAKGMYMKPRVPNCVQKHTMYGVYRNLLEMILLDRFI